MKKQTVLLFVALVVLSASNALAQTCPTPPTYWAVGPSYFWDFTPHPSCVTVTGSPTPGAASMCYSIPSYTSSGWTLISYTFTVPYNRNEPNWSTMVYVNFDDPDDDSQNSVEIYATVNSGTPQLVDSHYGSAGDLGCAQMGGPFNAGPNDSVKIEVLAYNANSAAIDIAVPYIFLEP